MPNIKKKTKKFDRILLIFIITITLLVIFIFTKPSITGKVILDKETVHSETLNIQKNESGVYEWRVKNPGDIKSLKVTGSVSANGTARVYIEKEGERRLLFDSTKQLFDVNIHVLPEYKSVFQGEKILIQNILFNLRGFGAGNVNVKYSIKDSKGNIIAAEEEIVFIETQAKFIRELIVPEINSGVYTAFVEAYTNGTIVGTGSDTFEVKAKYEEPYYRQLKFYVISAFVLVALIIAFSIGIYGLNMLKKKKKIAELKEQAPLEKIEKIKKELKALEDAYKAGFISKESYKKEKARIEAELKKLRR